MGLSFPAGDDEEDVDSDVTASKHGRRSVEDDDEEDGEAAKALDIRAESSAAGARGGRFPGASNRTDAWPAQRLSGARPGSVSSEPDRVRESRVAQVPSSGVTLR